MTPATTPYSVPDRIEASLERVRAYWASLKRGLSDMPYWDDVDLAALAEVADDAFLIDAFAKPERFRFRSLGGRITRRYGTGIANKFVDEIEIRAPFQFLESQCSATIEQQAPTYYRYESEAAPQAGQEAYARLLLPMWGQGRIGMLLGAIAWSAARNNP